MGFWRSEIDLQDLFFCKKKRHISQIFSVLQFFHINYSVTYS